MAAHRPKLLCQNCRLRHLKCDDKQPACSKCEASGSECIRGFYVRFKHLSQANGLDAPSTSRFSWMSDQVWPRTSGSDDLIFHDETESIVRVYEHEPSDESHAPKAAPAWPSSSMGARLPPLRSVTSMASPPLDHPSSATSAPMSPAKKPKHSHPSSPPGSAHGFRMLLDAGSLVNRPRPPSTSSPSSPVPYPPPNPHGSDARLPHPAGVAAMSPLSPPASYSTQSAWPLASVAEAQLLRYYVAHIAPWFDVCDQNRHFGVVIPQRAAYCPPLLQGIFTVAARHRSISNRGYDPYVADRYHEKCLTFLQRVIHDPAAIVDENLFAATVVLRFLEEIDESESDAQSHLIGVKALIAEHQRALLPRMTGLRLACYWIALRQELVISFTHQRPMQWDLQLVPLDYASCEPTDDDNWANRIVVFCAHVITYSFDPGGDRSMERWQELRDQAERWRRSLPASFDPCWYAPGGADEEDPLPFGNDGAGMQRSDSDYARGSSGPRRRSALPQIWHLSPVHVIAHQHRLLALILLSAHDPSIPRLGPSRRQRLEAADAEIRRHVLDLAGLGWCNSSTPTNMKTASMGIQVAGERLTDPDEQAAVYAVLARTERECRWPTKKARDELRRAWGWETGRD